MKFTKMHGIGNDYIYINTLEEEVHNISSVARFVSDRHFGIGSDGLVLIGQSDTCDFKMRMFNSDGSEAEMCGNAIRCVGKYVYDNKMTDKSVLTIETLAGIKKLEMTLFKHKVSMVKVDMGEPVLIPKEIPVNSDGELFINVPINILDKTFHVTGVSMGNPHAISYIDDVDHFELEKYGSVMEVYPMFPKKINSEFVQVIDRKTLKMRVWERGAGETLACGTGACAVLVASVMNQLCDREATVKLLGGDLLIEWNEKDNHVYMTGPATTVFTGEIEI
ncbi:MAG: diaminopimelate epimerase [Clostridia bacterium]|nr:diaminopimelate epimerase [Clostridia bacterium]